MTEKRKDIRFMFYNKLKVCSMVLVIILTGVLFAGVEVPTLLSSGFADTEVSTNVVLEAWGRDHRIFEFGLRLDATCSNNVEVAFGKDRDGDRVLDVDEVAYTVGWDCGKWMLESVDNAYQVTMDSPTNAVEKSLKISLVTRKDGSVKAFAFCLDEVPQELWSLAEIPEWFKPSSHDILRVTVRGADVSHETISVSRETYGFAVILH